MFIYWMVNIGEGETCNGTPFSVMISIHVMPKCVECRFQCMVMDNTQGVANHSEDVVFFQ